MIFGTVKAIAEGAKELVHLLRLRQEMKLNRQLLDELERVEDEQRQLTQEIDDARNNGDHGLADWLLQRQTDRLIYSAGIYSIAKGRDFHRSAPDDTSDGSSDST